MAKEARIDEAAAHEYFATYCFNHAWDLIEKEDRSAEDDRLMVAMSHASIYHWFKRVDCDNEKLSVGYWQLSRVLALTGSADEALKTARTSLSYSAKLDPFYVGYAYEALARAASLTGDRSSASQYIKYAREAANRVTDDVNRNSLLEDLSSI